MVTEGGKIERKRRSVKLGYLEDISSKREAQQKLAVVLKPINDLDQIPKMRITFREFIERYRSLKLANKKETTVHGYETNMRVHYLPAFGTMRLSDISIETLQPFLNEKTIEGKAVQTIKNLKWGLSSIFAGAMKYGYMSSNPVKGTELPPEPIRERKEFPTFAELSLMIEHLKEPISTAVWLVAVSFVRSNELAFKWKDLDVERRMPWVVRAVN